MTNRFHPPAIRAAADDFGFSWTRAKCSGRASGPCARPRAVTIGGRYSSERAPKAANPRDRTQDDISTRWRHAVSRHGLSRLVVDHPPY
jgi:hypothetical protein